MPLMTASSSPYLLVDELYGVSFSVMDEIALSMGVERDSRNRVEAAVLFEPVDGLGLPGAQLPQPLGRPARGRHEHAGAAGRLPADYGGGPGPASLGGAGERVQRSHPQRPGEPGEPHHNQPAVVPQGGEQGAHEGQIHHAHLVHNHRLRLQGILGALLEGHLPGVTPSISAGSTRRRCA